MVFRFRSWVVILVDAGSTALQIPDAVHSYGYQLVHVRSEPKEAAARTRVPTSATYDADIDCSQSLEPLRKYLHQCDARPLAVLCGSDLGVALADKLAAEFSCPGNDPRSSILRREKGPMQSAVEAAGLLSIPSLTTDSADVAMSWSLAHNGPLAVKPVDSSASVGFRRIESRDQLNQTFDELLQTKTSFGHVVAELVVQPFIDGDEFALNAIAVDGEVGFINGWKTYKREVAGHRVYDLELSIDVTSEETQHLRTYATEAMRAVGLVNGPAHIELIVQGSEVRLMEIGARLMGSIAISQEQLALGTNCVRLLSEYAIRPQSVLALIRSAHRGSSLTLAMVQLLSDRVGKFDSINHSLLRRLPSFHGVDLNLSYGDHVRRTTDSLTSPGLVFLAAESPDQILSDYRRIRDAESEGALYQLI